MDEEQSPNAMVRRPLWVLAGMLVLVQVVWTNLTGLGIGRFPFTYDSVALPRLVVTVLGVLLFALLASAAAARSRWPVAHDRTLWILGALAVWAVVSAAASEQGTLVWLGQSERLEGAVTVALYAALYWAGLQAGDSDDAPRVLSLAVVAGSMVLSLHGLTQVLRIDRTAYLTTQTFDPWNAFASLDNPNFFGALLVLVLPLTVALAIAERPRWLRGVLWATAAVQLALLISTVSQGAWLAVVLEGALAAGLYVATSRAKTPVRLQTTPRRFAHPGVVVGGLLVLGVLVIAGVSALGLDLGLAVPETLQSRLALLEVTVDAAVDRPLTGYGPDTYLAAFRMYRPDSYAKQFGIWSTNGNSHSWVMQYLGTMGFPGALLLAAALASGLYAGRPRRGAQRTRRSFALIAVWIGLLGFVAQAMLNVSMLAATVPFWVLLGLVNADHASRREVVRGVATAATVVCAAALVAALAVSASLLAADAAYLESRLAYNGTIDADPVTSARRAVALNPLSVKYSRGLAQALGRNARAEALAGGGADDASVRRAYQEAEQAYRATLARSPRDYASLAWFAALQAEVGSALQDEALLAESKATAQRAARLDRSHWQVRQLAAGDTSSFAIQSALSVPGLP